jgi:hypothetical protein
MNLETKPALEELQPGVQKHPQLFLHIPSTVNCEPACPHTCLLTAIMSFYKQYLDFITTLHLHDFFYDNSTVFQH